VVSLCQHSKPRGLTKVKQALANRRVTTMLRANLSDGISIKLGKRSKTALNLTDLKKRFYTAKTQSRH